MIQTLKSLDMYGRKINLRFSDQDQFTTFCGLISTSLLFFTTISVLIFQLKAVGEGRLISVTTLKTPIDRTNPEQQGWKQDQMIGFAIDHDSSEGFDLS